MLFKKLMLKKLYSRKIVPFEIPGDARELTEDEMLLVNGGGGSMSPEDQQAMTEAGRRGDVDTQNAIRAKYENNTPTTPANPTQPVTATTTVTTPQPVNSGTADITPADGGIGSSNSPESSGGSSVSSGGSSSGGSNGNNSPKPSITPQISTPTSQQDHNLKVGAAHVEDYKKAAMKSLGIKETSSSGRKVPGWRNNGDGTHTVISKEANLWDLYGPNWKELSHYEGDPKKLHVGDTVGKKIKVNPGAGNMTITEMIEREKKKGLQVILLKVQKRLWKQKL